MKKIKLCGFSESTTLQVAVDCGCDFIGVVFAKNSARYVSPQDSKKLANLIPQNIDKVAVVLGENHHNLENLAEIYDNFEPQYFQIHADKNQDYANKDYIHKIRKKFPNIKIIFAIGVLNQNDLERMDIFNDCVDFFLFDNKNPGSGLSFNWDLLKNFHCNRPWFLSGGINISNIDFALEKTGADYIDISSGIELFKGIKSTELIRAMMHKIKSFN